MISLLAITKLKYLYHIRETLPKWDRNYIEKIHDGDDEQGGVGCFPPGTRDHILAEYLTDKQMFWIHRLFRLRVEKPILGETKKKKD